MPEPTKEQLLEFAESVARLYVEGDVRDMGDGSYSEYSPDGNDEEVTCLYSLIGEARMLTGAKPDNLADRING